MRLGRGGGERERGREQQRERKRRARRSSHSFPLFLSATRGFSVPLLREKTGARRRKKGERGRLVGATALEKRGKREECFRGRKKKKKTIDAPSTLFFFAPRLPCLLSLACCLSLSLLRASAAVRMRRTGSPRREKREVAPPSSEAAKREERKREKRGGGDDAEGKKKVSAEHRSRALFDLHISPTQARANGISRDRPPSVPVPVLALPLLLPLPRARDR